MDNLSKDSKPDGAMRLARFMASAGIASRRRCEELIADGRVTVNGKAVLTPACVVDPAVDEVRYEGHPLTVCRHEYVMLNKPVGYTCTMADDHAEHIVYELLPKELGRLFSIGRLDRDSEGLLLFTNDGELAQLLSHPSHEVEKRYIADCDGSLSESKARLMLEGVDDGGEILRAIRVRKLREKPGRVMLEVVLAEGKKREVRRLCAKVGLEVVRLARVEFGGIELGTLPTGEWRRLTSAELSCLRHSAVDGDGNGPGNMDAYRRERR